MPVTLELALKASSGSGAKVVATQQLRIHVDEIRESRNVGGGGWPLSLLCRVSPSSIPRAGVATAWRPRLDGLSLLAASRGSSAKIIMALQWRYKNRRLPKISFIN
jgi:hypothetical protein